MEIVGEIESAVAAHGQWKAKLRAAIDTGECDSTPDRVKQDNNCSFGKWLHDRIGSEHKSSEYYRDVLDLHAQFHREAGAILQLAVSGDVDQANGRMGIGGQFRRLSADLTSRLNAWKSSLGG